MIDPKTDPKTEQTGATTVDPAELEKFSKIADEWWDPSGKFKPLHNFNPTRIAYIRDSICQHFDRDPLTKNPLHGIRILDVGCGGGLVCEPMRRLGASVTGLDAAERNIKTAMIHAADHNLEIDYRTTTIELLVTNAEPQFDVVLNLEAVEHVADVDLFLSSSAQLVKPGGLMIVATINRTLKAIALAKIGAEYVLGWLPRGTHDPQKFVKPQEIERAFHAAKMTVTARAGVIYNPLTDAWKIADNTDVNYMMTATKPFSNV